MDGGGARAESACNRLLTPTRPLDALSILTPQKSPLELFPRGRIYEPHLLATMRWLFPESLQRDVVEGKWTDAVSGSACTWWAVAVAPTPTGCAPHPLLIVPLNTVFQFQRFFVRLL